MRSLIPLLSTLALTISVGCATPKSVDAVSGSVDGLDVELASLKTDVEALRQEVVALREDSAEALSAAQTQLQAGLDETNGALATVESDLGELTRKHERDLSTLNADDAALDARIDAQRRDLEDQLDARVVLVGRDTTINVPADAKDLYSALATLDGQRIVGGAKVRVVLAKGDYAMVAPLIIDHPDGHAITIEGASGDPDDVTLSFVGTSGISIPPGRALGQLKGITLDGDGSGSGVVHGLEVRSNGTITVRNVVVQDFKDDCVHVENGGVLLANLNGLEVSACGEDGVDARWGSVIRARGFVSSDAGADGLRLIGGALGDMEGARSTNAGSDGATVQMGSMLFAPGFEASDNATHGVRVREGAWATLDDAVCENNGYDGIFAERMSTVRAYNSTSQSNGDDGWAASSYSVIDARSAHSTGNGGSNFAEGLGARIYRD